MRVLVEKQNNDNIDFLSIFSSDMLVFWDKEVAQASTMILHNCLLEAEVKEELCKYVCRTPIYIS